MRLRNTCLVRGGSSAHFNGELSDGVYGPVDVQYVTNYAVVSVNDKSFLEASALCAGPTSPAAAATTTTRAVILKANAGILCEPCNGKGWLICEFCKGQKTNVKAENNRIYRRCPSCRAVGYVLCPSCKVFKCITFPNYTDGDELSF